MKIDNSKNKRRSFASPQTPDRFARERTYDVKHICLKIRVHHEEKSISGTATIDIEPINDGFRTFFLDAAELRIRSVKLVGAPRLSKPRSLSHSTFDHRLEIDLPRSYRGGDSLSVTVRYDAQPRKGLYFIAPDEDHPNRPMEVWTQGQDEDSKFWFPCYDFPNDKATSELIATVDASFFALSNGELLSMKEDRRRGLKTYHWRENHPHPAYLTSLVVGDYEEHRDEWNGVPVTYYVHPEDRGKVERSFGRTPEMMKFFSRIIDYPYPYEKYAQICVTDFTFGGMENISATTLTALTLHDERAHADVPSDRLVAHELAHQWWGNLITCKEWTHGWLNEGFATYFDALYTEHSKNRDEFLYQILTDREAYIEEDESDYRRPLVQRKFNDPLELFDRHLYEKGGQVLHMLRFELGEALFWKALRHYCRRHAYRSVETADLKIAIEEATGKSMDRFFDQWVYRPGYPECETEWSWSDGILRFRLRQVQERGDGTPLFSMSADVEVAGPKGAKSFRVQISEPDQTFYFPVGTRPEMVRLDPEGWLLKKLNAKKSRQEWIYQLENSNVVGKVEAAEALGRMKGDMVAVEALARAGKKDRFWGVRSRAAKALGEQVMRESLAALVDIVADQSSRVRRAAAEALGNFGKHELALRTLIGMLEKDRSYYVQARAAKSLGGARDRSAWKPLTAALRRKSHRDVVSSTSLLALSELDEKRAYSLVRRYASPGKPRFVREAAFVALAKIGKSRKEHAADVRRLLIDALHDGAFHTQLTAARALGELGDGEALPELDRVAIGDIHSRLRKAARSAAEKIRKGMEGNGEVGTLREEIEGLKQENLSLRNKLSELEARLTNGRGKKK